MDKEHCTRMAIKSARVQGCKCNVKIEFVEVKGKAAEINIRHDDWCPLLTKVRTGLTSEDQVIMFK
jgi:hypothetical protein